jgi:glutathione peroxidase
MDNGIYEIGVETLDGQPVGMESYRGKVLLIVNTASKCGMTPQYAGLQVLHERLGKRGLAVLGFPCNQFGAQEPGDAEQIGEFCEKNYGVSFPMHAKIEVNGGTTHPLYQFLKSQVGGDIEWNFTKFLVDTQGNVVQRFGPQVTPETIAPEIERLLG